MYFFRKFKKLYPERLVLSGVERSRRSVIIISAILVIFFVFSQTSFGKKVFLETGILEAIRDFLNLKGDTLSAADYKDGTILLIKPVATGVGEGRYEAGDIVEIRDGEEMYKRFGNGNFLGAEERTMLLPLYYPGKLTEEQKRELTEPEVQAISNDQKTEMKNEKMVMRRKMGVDYTQFLSDSEILKVRNLEKLKKLPKIDLSVIIKKGRDRVSVVEMPKSLAKIESARNTIKKLAGKIIPLVFAQSEVVKIVDTGNGPGTDYTSLNAWAAQDLDLVNLNQIAIAKCRATNGVADTVAVTIDGWTTDADHYIKIWTDPNESYRHNGKWDDGKYRIVTTTAGGSIVIAEEYVRVEGIQISNGNSVENYGILSQAASGETASSDIRISNNIVKSIYPTAVASAGMSLNRAVNLKVWNNIVYDFKIGISIYRYTDLSLAWVVYSNTVYNASTYGYWSYNNTNAKFLAKNDIAQNCADGFYSAAGSWHSSSDYNLSDIAGDAPGANSKNGVTVQFVDAANKDFHLRQGDSGARNNGANLRNDANLSFSDDIDGENRPETGAWDIGADEVARTTQINTPLSGRFIDSSLKGYWSFDGADMNATTAIDRSGNNNDGDVRNGAQKVPGINGQALSFDGVDDQVVINSVLGLGNTNVTIANWVYLYSASESGAFVKIGKEFAPSGGDGYAIGVGNVDFDSNGNKLILLYEGVRWISTNTNIGIGWHHVAMTINGSVVPSVYLDGRSLGSFTGTNSVAPTAGGVKIGGYAGSGAENRFGSYILDEVRVYNRVLSTDEIAEQYRAGSARLKINTPITLAGPQSGLVGNWTFNGQDTNWTSATAGTTADKSGNNNTGTMTNMSRSTSPAIGISGQALSFDGVDDLVNAGSASSLDDIELQGGGGMTISAWIYPKGAGEQNYGAIVTKGYTGGNNGWIFDIESAGLGLGFFRDYTTTDLILVTTYPSIVLNTWQHVVATWDGSATASNIKIYRNGILAGTRTSTNGVGDKNSDGTNNLVIGNWSNVVTFDGLIDEVRIYNRALSQSEITDLYLLGTRKFQPTQ